MTVVVCVVAVLSLVTVIAFWASSSIHHPAAVPVWGLAGGYAGVDLNDVRNRGVKALLVEMSWAEAEPTPNVIDTGYMDSIAQQIQGFRSQGFRVALNYGLQDAPAWLLALPSARYVNQFGSTYTSEPLADLVFDTALRPYAEQYTDIVMRRLGTQVFMVRVGGGHDGELDYPAPIPGDGGNDYWAFSAAAQKTAPDKGWRPCTPATEAIRQRFLDWYLDALVDFQNWQIATVRQSYAGQIAVLYPSVGFSEADMRAALSDGLCGRTPGERSTAVQRGFDPRRQAPALSGPNLIVYCTWAENPLALDQLGRLARTHHLRLAGENSGFNDASQLRFSVAQARRWHMTAFFWIRAEQAYCDCNKWATITDYHAAIT